MGNRCGSRKKVEMLSLNTLGSGNMAKITAKANVTVNSFSWESSNDDIASITIVDKDDPKKNTNNADVIIMAEGDGVAVITLTAEDVKATLEVTVDAPIVNRVIRFTTASNGYTLTWDKSESKWVGGNSSTVFNVVLYDNIANEVVKAPLANVPASNNLEANSSLGNIVTVMAPSSTGAGVAYVATAYDVTTGTTAVTVTGPGQTSADPPVKEKFGTSGNIGPSALASKGYTTAISLTAPGARTKMVTITVNVQD